VVARPEREITLEKLGLFLDELQIAPHAGW
jgi:hypothetical protein